MVYTDKIHLMASNLKELHNFAASIGLKRHWFHNKRNKKHPHYDLKGKYVELAIKKGALVTTTRWLIMFNRLNQIVASGEFKQLMIQYGKEHPLESSSAKWSREYKEMESLYNAMKQIYN